MERTILVRSGLWRCSTLTGQLMVVLIKVVHHRVLIHSSANGSPPYWWFPLYSPHFPQNYDIFHMISVILLYYKQILAKFLDLSVWSITSIKPTITCLELAAFCLAFSKLIFNSRKRVFFWRELHGCSVPWLTTSVIWNKLITSATGKSSKLYQCILTWWY